MSLQFVHQRIVRPISEFIHSQASGGIILLACTIIALAWANSPWGDAYRDLWHIEFSVAFGGQTLSLQLHEWINDGLMAVFFLLVGLEIKREFLVGELASPKNAMLPIVAAIGGMVVPAALYAIVNAGHPSANGWAVPMATDIAFSLGVLALLGSRAPLGIKVFLTALAIVDDLGAVLVIALFYSNEIDTTSLLICGMLLVSLIVLNVLKVRRLTPYLVIGFLMWAMMLNSGVHATIAGVLLALCIPTRVHLNATSFIDRCRGLLQKFDDAPEQPGDLLSEEQQSAIYAIERSCEGVQMPLQRLESALHSPVNYVVVPLFALANAGLVLSGLSLGDLATPVTSGVILGLVLGKSVGITLFAWLSVKMKLADLPKHVTWTHVVGAAFLGGIGFTMSLFVSGLAFSDPGLSEGAKLGILTGSLVSGVVGALLIMRVKGRARPSEEEGH